MKKNVYKIGLQSFFFKLATNGQNDKGFVDIKSLSPRDCLGHAQGLYTYIKSLKMCLKSYFKEIVLKLATNEQSDKGFLLSLGVVCPCPGVYTCIKAFKYIPGPVVR